MIVLNVTVYVKSELLRLSQNNTCTSGRIVFNIMICWSIIDGNHPHDDNEDEDGLQSTTGENEAASFFSIFLL